MISLSIDTSKIDKTKLVVKGDKKYLNLVAMDRPDDYGNDGFVAMSVTKEERARGERGPIVGNWRHVGQRQAPQQRQAAPPPKSSDDDIPFM